MGRESRCTVAPPYFSNSPKGLLKYLQHYYQIDTLKKVMGKKKVIKIMSTIVCAGSPGGSVHISDGYIQILTIRIIQSYDFHKVPDFRGLSE